MDVGFVKTKRSKEVFKLMKVRKSAYVLLSLIALRARRTNDRTFDNLEIGEALIGDYESYDTTEQVYRTDKKFLEKHKFITTRVTSRGTIAKLIDTTIFDINPEGANDRTNDQLTTSQRPANDQLTTNKNDKNDKNVKNIDSRSLKINLNSFKPMGYEELKVREIVEVLGEDNFSYVYGKYRKGEFWAIEKAWVLMCESDVNKFKNKGAYFAGLVKNILTEARVRR